jgi:hypothetical protein
MKEKNKQKDKKEPLKSGAEDLFDSWRRSSRIEPEDSTLTILKKIGIKIGGILLFILFSPLLLIIFLFVVAVSL